MDPYITVHLLRLSTWLCVSVCSDIICEKQNTNIKGGTNEHAQVDPLGKSCSKHIVALTIIYSVGDVSKNRKIVSRIRFVYSMIFRFRVDLLSRAEVLTEWM